ncbi:MAG: ParB/RepB/Spo0J family partition protein [Patescibacteria group bacterium]
MPLGKGLNSLISAKPRSFLRRETGQPSNNKDQIWHIPISEITPNTEQPRREFSHNEMEDLVLSVKQHGILQPITVTEKEDGGYELIAGERRLRASQIAGLPTVPAIVRAASKRQKLEWALIENIQRQDLNPIEEAFAYARLIEEFNLTQEQVAEQVGKSRPTVANMLRLLALPESIQKSLIDGQLSVGKAKALLSLASPKEQLEMFKSMTGEKMSVRDLEHRVAMHPATSRKGFVRRDPNVMAQEKLLEERLGTKVYITQKGQSGKITIEYYSQEELKRIISFFYPLPLS